MKTNNQTWKQVTISGVTGILMGAGALKAMQAIQSNDEGDVASDSQLASTESAYDDMSFREAFEAARAELGAGGVFRWHGNIYNTYTADEWNAKTEEEQDAFAEEVGAEIGADEIDTSDFAEEVDAEVTADEVESSDLAQTEEVKVETEEETDDDVRVALDDDKNDVAASAASEQTIESDDDDVRVLGFGEVTLENGQNVTVQELDINGQRVAVIDVDQDGEADFAMTDLNQNQQMDEGEVIDLHTGEAVSFTNDNNDDLAMTVDTVDL